ncbi:hypothetical protein EDB19DRAFT_2027887 [Suillus lakei]|nr:hypothetical protein EDB19DRAFT_2027887 [Suillus lakei]
MLLTPTLQPPSILSAVLGMTFNQTLIVVCYVAERLMRQRAIAIHQSYATKFTLGDFVPRWVLSIDGRTRLVEGASQKRVHNIEHVSKLILGGDHIARAVDRTLGINDSQFEDSQLDTPINNWLADNKPDVLAIVFFFTHFCNFREWPKEDKEDLRVKN